MLCWVITIHNKMRLLLTLFIILAISQMAKAQEKGFSIGMGGSFDKHINEYRERLDFPIPNPKFYDILEYSFGLQVNYLFNERLGIRSGVSYARKGYMVTYDWVLYDINGLLDPLIPVRSEYRLAYLDIPIGVYYQVVSTNRYHLSPSIGIMNSILIGEREVTEMLLGEMKETDYNTSEPNPYLLGARLGLINDFNLNESIFISLEPYVMYNFTKLNDTDIVNSDFAFGGYLSVNYRFIR